MIRGSSPTGEHIRELDGLRGVAILLVFAFHSCSRPSASFQHEGFVAMLFLRLVNMGWSGVDLFFALSGYLITGILLRGQGATNFFKVFYFRRLLRIFPIYYLTLMLAFWVQPWLPVKLQLDQGHHALEQVWYWLNLSNFRTALKPLLIPSVTHYWSLAIEEQFYLVWPWIVRRFRDRSLLVISVVGITMAIFLRNLPVVQMYNATYSNFIYRVTPFRVDSLLFGAVLAILLRNQSRTPAMTRWVVCGLSVGLALVLIATEGLSVNSMASPSMTRYGYTGLSFVYCSLVATCVLWSGTSSPIASSLRARPLRELGKYSYCIYVIHLAVLGIIDRVVSGHLLHYKPLLPSHPYGSQVIIGLLGLAACYLLARISWLLVEEPALRLKDRFRYEYAAVPQEA